MKKLSIAVCIILVMVTSCNDYLDINRNENKPTSVKPELILPQALAATALVLNNYNTYGMQLGGYAANAGGFGAFNEAVSYAFTSNNFGNLWSPTYDNLEDYQTIIKQTEGDDKNLYFYAVAKIMKAHGFQLLVDTYNDVPYTEALKGNDNLSPAYDAGEMIYASLATELDEAMAAIRKANDLPLKNSIENYDIVFEGDMNAWLALANTIKLKLMVRGKGKVVFANTSFDAVGFLTDDALINPGYARDFNRQNPKWDAWGFQYTGNSGNKGWMPNTFALAFYDGHKLEDEGRGLAIFYNFPATGSNQLGNETPGIPKSPEGSFWYPSSNRTGTAAGDVTGVLKGPDAGMPLLTAAESYFLQAEASVVGIATPATGSAKALFEAGIVASFQYLYKLPDGSYEGDYAGDAAAYIVNNPDPLVQFDRAVSNEQKIEAIITQKYIAMNMVNSQEGWNDYRRTGYPKITGTAPTETFASVTSQATRPDKLPTRIPYPSSEVQYNGANVPSDVAVFTSLIFWAK